MEPVELHGLRDQRYFECLCGIHVHRGSYIVAIIGLIFSTISILFAFMLKQIIVIPFPITSLILYLLVLIAYKKQKPALYLPFIILNTFGAGLILCVAIFVLLSGSAVTIGGFAVSNKPENYRSFGIIGGITIGFGTILFLWGILSAYFIHVVYRAYRYMREFLLKPTLASQIEP